MCLSRGTSSLTKNLSSLSEFGCVDTVTGRKFGEIPSLFKEATPVYSGGLVYEYTKEGDTEQQKYGLVTAQGSSSATERPDFALLQKAFKDNQPPSGDGGYKPSGKASTCPTRSKTWLVDGDGLPAMPPKAKAFFKNGAGQGVGLTGEGSQEVGAESTGTATPGSGAVTATGSSSSATGTSSGESAASGLRAPDFTVMPLVCGLVVVVSSLLGGAILL